MRREYPSEYEDERYPSGPGDLDPKGSPIVGIILLVLIGAVALTVAWIAAHYAGWIS